MAHTYSLPGKNDPESGNCTGGGGVGGSAPLAPSEGVSTPRSKQQEAGVSSRGGGGGGVGGSSKYRYEVCFDNIVDQEEEYTVSISTGMTSTSKCYCYMHSDSQGSVLRFWAS